MPPIGRRAAILRTMPATLVSTSRCALGPPIWQIGTDGILPRTLQDYLLLDLEHVQVDGRQINLGADREVAFRQYHQLMQQPTPAVALPISVASIVDALNSCRSVNFTPNRS